MRLAIINANPLGPVGIFDGGRQSETISTNKQMRTAAEFRDIIIKSSAGNFVRLADVAEVEDSVRNHRSIAWFNKQPAVLIQITKQGDANVIDTVDRVRALIPELKQWLPGGVEISTLVDRTNTIRASVLDMQYTLLAAAFLVMVVVFIFLRRLTPTGTLRAARGLPTAVLMRGIITFAFFAVDAYVALALVEWRGLRPAEAGIALTAATISWTAGSWTQARLSSRYSSARAHRPARSAHGRAGPGIRSDLPDRLPRDGARDRRHRGAGRRVGARRQWPGDRAGGRVRRGRGGRAGRGRDRWSAAPAGRTRAGHRRARGAGIVIRGTTARLR